MSTGRDVLYGVGIGADAAASHWLNHLSFDFRPRSEYINNESSYGVNVRTNDATVIRKWAEGDLEAKLTADTAGVILLGAFGSVTTGDNADSNAAVKDHTFDLNDDVSGQQLTFYRVDQDLSTTEKYTNARIGEWELSMSLDNYLTYTASVMAKTGQSTTATPALVSNPTEFVAKHFSVKTAATAAGLGAATAISTVESLTLTVNPNIEPDYAAGSDEPYSFTGRGYELSFELTKRYTDTTYQDAYNDGDALALQISAVNTDVTIGAAANPGLVFTAPKVTINDWSRDEGFDSARTETISGTIHYSPADAYALRAVLTNTTASYA